ncbi:exopolysaccharide production repressor protein [Mesorhizobium huakuii]|uniref:Exopolysaccharide production repressor exox n=1 Tax=Mesorhizobium huakuii TaxID=28104 RepID=A0A7G6T1C4_9HYPH|nr:exopolysaccharide production repressor protein [Mesorhizobium huakuii]QND60556.1 hypothetical protein HB778_31455 [Mesorhizobium huakuii]
MYFPQFLLGMLTTSGVVGAWAYVATGSMWRAVAWGIIAAAVLQVGYFALVFRLVYGRRDMKQEQKKEANPESTEHQVVTGQPLQRDDRR